MIKAILFDFNGVIINDEPIQHAAFSEIFGEQGIEISDEMYYSRLGMDDKTFAASILEEAGRDSGIDKVLEITTNKTLKWRDQISREVPLFPGVEGFIRKMAKDFELGIVSMAKSEEIEFVLEKTGLFDLFSVIISAEEVNRCKPDPQCYRKGFEQIDLVRIEHGHAPMNHAECLVIEDSPPGVAAGAAAGLKVLGVTNTVSADELRRAGADAIAEDLGDWMPSSIRRVFTARV